MVADCRNGDGHIVWRNRLWLAFVVVAAVNGQAPGADTALLGQIRARVAENVLRLPNYTCTEQIERWVRAPRERRLRRRDTIRLNVAYVGGKELYGLPGAGRVDKADVGKLVQGTISTGQFALYLNNIFVERDASFSRPHKVKLEDKPAFRFDYQVPLSRSGIRIRSGVGEAIVEAIVGYSGAIWVDRATVNLMRLTAKAEHLPRLLDIRSDVTITDYAPVSIAGRGFRLPSHSQYDAKGFSGAESRNVIAFENCSEYVGESVLKFDDRIPLPDK